MLNRLRSLVRALKSREDFEQGMSEELRFHIDQLTDDLVRSGVSREEAARRARMELGSAINVREDCREARGLRLFDSFTRQLRHAFRLLRKAPGFTATALVTLAVCCGANLAIFAVIDAILLRPLPFPDADRLVTIYNTYPKAGVDRDGSSVANYYERRGTIPAFSSVAMYSYGTNVVGETGSTERERTAYVTPEFFATLGTVPVLGRAFTEEETGLDANKVVILTDAYWRTHFNADPQIAGRQLRADGSRFTIVGVLPASFRFLSTEARLYFPFSSGPADRLSTERHSGGNNKHMIARLSPGSTIAQAQAQIDTQNAALETADRQAKMMADAGFRSVVASLHGDHVAAIRPALLWMQAGAFALLLIGAVNLTNLLLIRASGRSKEMAVRQALGASRSHVLGEVIVETSLLTLAGGLLGLAVGAAGIQLLTVLGADRLPLGSHIEFDARLACVALAGAVALGLALAAPIAWFNLRGHLTASIQSETRSTTSSRAAQSLRHGFIVGQIALTLVLLAAAGLLALSLDRAMAVSPGFRAAHVLTGQISIPGIKYPNVASRLSFNERLLSDVAHQPGVSAVGIVDNVPLSGRTGKSAAAVKGYQASPGDSPRGHYSYGVDGDYFAAMGFTLIEGRFLTAADSRRSGRVCVVDEDFARYYWPHGGAIGQRLFQGSEIGDDSQAFTVVGVVGAVKQAGLTDQVAQGAVYYPYAQRVDNTLFLVVRSSVTPDLQRFVRQIDPELPVTDLMSMDARISDSLLAQRSPAFLAAIFSVIAILLTAVGTYGVLSYAVAQRRREIGVRMALGASPGQIRAHFLSLALRLLAAGTLLGIAGAWLAGQAMRTLLFQVPATHIATFAAAAVTIGVVAMIACTLPALRAARTSPVEALADQ
jgi:predicted permease